ncbi:hypothetical protein QCN29_05095 [Streptomyces sp. HNM0663]|uniref:Uncharacterized protein n=1 Tax=Streptomyces chengmaiensis TaxID=3040919 RepID=A0ABT6HHV7_9ACTN|nr:hypothetical protein [Streptomyces chengmaiensis]
MPSSAERVERIAARFSGAGLVPRMTEHSNHTCIEAEVPSPVSADSWRDLLSVLDSADWFGLVDSSHSGRTVWAAVSKEAPGTVHAAQDSCHQP